MTHFANHIIGWVAAVLLLFAAGSASSQTPAWRPEKPVEVIASSAPGGGTDRTARTIQRLLQNHKLVPVPVNVVNRPGGNQTLARAYLNQQAGDAHYFDIGNPTLLSNHIAGVSRQHYSDFSPIVLLLNDYTVFTVRADSPIRSARDLVERLQQNPDAVSIGISNRGGTNHLTLSLLAKHAGVEPRRLKVVVFKSNAESLTALLGGHIQMVASTATPVIGQATAGSARAIAVGAPQRMSGALAEVPTLREQGFDVTLSNWRAIVGPRGLTAAQVAYWEEVMAKAVSTEEWKQELQSQLWEANFLRSREFHKYLETEYEVIRGIMTELGLAKAPQ